MLDVIFQILSIIGIILLVLLGVVLVLLLLVLFFPITYRFYGSKTEDIVTNVKAKWFFGLLRVSYSYPKTATLSVKVLWHTLFQKKIPRDNTDNPEIRSDAKDTESIIEHQESSSIKNTTTAEMETLESSDEIIKNQEVEEESSQKRGFSKKNEKIKYTISNIYDKIKEICKNITYYMDLLKEENTKALFQHVTRCLGKILKSIRPRHMKADIVFGTGSPDTTGYAYGVYGMLATALGPSFLVEPDFEQAVLKGEIQFSGHITIWVLLINALKLFFDPKLHLFLKKVKAGMPKKEK